MILQMAAFIVAVVAAVLAAFNLGKWAMVALASSLALWFLADVF